MARNGLFYLLSLAALGLRPALQDPADVRIEHFAQRWGASKTMLVPKKEGWFRIAAGGVLAAAGRLARSEGLQADLLDSAGFDAIAPSAEDLPFVRETKLPIVCANVLRPDGKPVAPSYLIKTSGKARVAFVGVLRPASYRKGEELKGWTVNDPVTTLKQLLPEVAKVADVVVLVAIMDRLECAALLKEASGVHLALVPGWGVNDPDPLVLAQAQLVQSPSGPDTLGRLQFRWEASRIGKVQNAFERSSLSPTDRERLDKLFARHSETPDAGRLIAGDPGVQAPGIGTAALQIGKSAPVRQTGANRGVAIRVDAAHLLTSFGGTAASPGSAWLVLDGDWTNVVPMTYVFEREAKPAYVLSKPTEVLFAVVNGRRAVPPDGRHSTLLERGLELPRVGSARRGALAFRVPAESVESLELRLYDFTHGHVTVQLLARPAPEPKPQGASQRNEILEAGVYGVRKAKQFGSEEAPAGSVFLVADFRARSLLTVSADATAFNANAKAGEKSDVGGVAEWADVRKRISVVVDGKDRISPHSACPEMLRFLPDLATGESFVFAVPEKASRLRLECEFGTMTTPGRGAFTPKALALELAGK